MLSSPTRAAANHSSALQPIPATGRSNAQAARRHTAMGVMTTVKWGAALGLLLVGDSGGTGCGSRGRKGKCSAMVLGAASTGVRIDAFATVRRNIYCHDSRRWTSTSTITLFHHLSCSRRSTRYRGLAGSDNHAQCIQQRTYIYTRDFTLLRCLVGISNCYETVCMRA